MTQTIQEPQIISFDGKIMPAKNNTGAETSNYVLLIPDNKLPDFGHLTKVEGTINGFPFRSELMDAPKNTNNDSHALKMSKSMCEKAKINLTLTPEKFMETNPDPTAEIFLLGPEEPLVLADDIQTAFDNSPQIYDLWNDLTELGQRDYIRWIEGAKTTETRNKRITRTVEQLSEGKRRACCINVNEYMMNKITAQKNS